MKTRKSLSNWSSKLSNLPNNRNLRRKHFASGVIDKSFRFRTRFCGFFFTGAEFVKISTVLRSLWIFWITQFGDGKNIFEFFENRIGTGVASKCHVASIQLLSRSQSAQALTMKERFKGIEIFLVISISAFLLVFPAYLRCTDLAGDRILSTDLSFENSDQIDGSAGQQYQLKASTSVIFPNKSLHETNLFEQFSRLFSRTLSNRREIFVLLCWEKRAPNFSKP